MSRNRIESEKKILSLYSINFEIIFIDSVSAVYRKWAENATFKFIPCISIFINLSKWEKCVLYPPENYKIFLKKTNSGVNWCSCSEKCKTAISSHIYQ